MSAGLRGPRAALVVLTLLNLFNYLDRFVLSSLVESLKASELHLTDTQLGALATGFILVYMLTSPIFGTLGDRKSRPTLLAAGVAIWSLATALGGFARELRGALFAARASVGVGEAAYGTIAPALSRRSLSEGEARARFRRLLRRHPDRLRRRATSSAASSTSEFGLAGGVLHGRAPGTRPRAALPRAVRPAARRAGPGRPATPPPGAAAPGRPTSTSLRNRPYVLTVLGYAAYTFALGGLAFWTPAFLERVRGMPRSEATVPVRRHRRRRPVSSARSAAAGSATGG